MIFNYFFLFAFGLVFGSFIAALTYRFPRGISNLKGRSFCDNCKEQIEWSDNIPLLSFLFLGAKCRYCKNTISPRYFIIELATGIGFLFTLQGLSLQSVYSTVLFCILEIIFIIDFENQIIPDLFIFLGLLFLPFTFYQGSDWPSFAYLSPFTYLLTGFACATFLLLIYLATRGRGRGLGDVKFAVLGGIIVGPALSPIWLFIAFLTGALVGIILIIGKKAGLKSKIAFGPFLILAIPLTEVFGNSVLKLMGLQ